MKLKVSLTCAIKTSSGLLSYFILRSTSYQIIEKNRVAKLNCANFDDQPKTKKVEKMLRR